MNKKSLITYLFIFFFLGISLFIFFLLKNTPLATYDEYTPREPHHKMDYSKEINLANNFYKNQQFQRALKTLNQIPLTDLTSTQKHNKLLFTASCNKALGLYNSALKNINTAQKYQTKAFDFFLKGLILEQTKNIDLALISFKKAIELDPYYTYSYEKAGDILYSKGNYNDAISFYYPKIKKKIFISDSSIIKIALCYYFSGDTKSAIKFSQKYIDLSKNRDFLATAYFVQAISYSKQMDFSEADFSFQHAISFSDIEEKPLFRYHYALYLIKNDKPKEAVNTLKSIIFSKRLGMPQATFALGQLFFKTGDYNQSLIYFKNNKWEASRVPGKYYFATSLYKLKQYSKALKLFNEIINSPEASDYSLSSYILAAISYSKLGETEKSLKLIRTALKNWGENKYLINTLGYITMSYKPELFYETLSRYFDNPKYKELNLLLCDYYIQKKRYKPAIANLLNYSQQYKPTPIINKQIGDIYTTLKDYHNAKLYYQDALKNITDKNLKTRIINNKAYVLYKLTKKEEAIRTLKNEVLKNNNKPSIYYNLAIINKDKKDFKSYIQNIERAKNLIANSNNKTLNSLIILESGIIAKNNAKFDTAKKLFKKSLEINPKNDVAEYFLKQLQ